IGHDFADEDLAGANRRHEKGLERAAFPLARHHERGEKGADQRHDDDNQARYEKPRAGVRLVEPDTLLDAYRADTAGQRGRFGSARTGQRDRALSISQHHARTIRIDTVDERLDRRGTGGKLAAEIRSEMDDPVDLAIEHELLRLARRHQGDRREVWR